jgi:cell division protein FtsB
MKYLTSIKSNVFKYYPYFFFPLIIIYLSFNIFDGNNGLLAHSRLDIEIATLNSEINDLKHSNHLYEVKISSLNKLDGNSDLIDEQIRNVLGYGKTNEYIIFFDK